jgi:hypothetical protein
MPFDFVKYKHYSINYTDLFDRINSNRILNDAYVQTHYLKRWREVLEYQDAALTNQLSTEKSIFESNLRLQSEPEIFQIPIHYINTEVLLHFRVSIANSLIVNEKSKAQYIPLDEFIRRDGTIQWNPIDTNVDSYANVKEPIIAVPFLINQYNLLVIDGNHRLTYKTRNNIDNIHALIISEQTVIEHSLFSSGFDKMYYIMHNEINHMADATNHQNISAMQIVQKSYLTDGKFKFQQW